MLNPRYLAGIGEYLVDLWEEIEKDLLADIAERIAKNEGLTATGEWRYIKLQELGVHQDHIVEQLSRMLDKSEKEMAKIVKDAVFHAVSLDNMIFKEAFEKGLIDRYSPISLSNLIVQGSKATNGTIRNFTKSYAAQISKIYEHSMDKAYLNVVSGLMSSSEATKNAIEELASKGIQTVTSSKGRTESAVTVVKRAIRTGSNQTALKSQEANFLAMGGSLIEVPRIGVQGQSMQYGKGRFMSG